MCGRREGSAICKEIAFGHNLQVKIPSTFHAPQDPTEVGVVEDEEPPELQALPPDADKVFGKLMKAVSGWSWVALWALSLPLKLRCVSLMAFHGYMFLFFHGLCITPRVHPK